MWLIGDYDFMIVTSEILQKLIPKFLLEEPNQIDTSKAKKILLSLLEIRQIKGQRCPEEKLLNIM